MKLIIDNQYITNNLNIEQLKSLTQYINNGYIRNNPNFTFDFNRIEIIK